MRGRSAVLIVAVLGFGAAALPALGGPERCPGVDSFNSGFQAVAEIGTGPDQPVGPALGGAGPITLAGHGPTTVVRGCQMGDTIQTEIVQMALTGQHPLIGPYGITESPTMHSMGGITNIMRSPAGDFLAGDSFFDVFFELQAQFLQLLGVQNGRVFNLTPFRVVNRITSLPPFDDGPYRHPPGQQTALWGVVGGQLRIVGYATAGCHRVLPPDGTHGICLTVNGKPDPETNGCLIGPVDLAVSDASQPPHVIGSASTAATGGGEVVSQWTDTDGDGTWGAKGVHPGALCVPVSVTAAATFTDGDGAADTITYLHRN